jgi:CelD/BcsL family acetyltransferase involved in cellulose biosynthesis
MNMPEPGAAADLLPVRHLRNPTGLLVREYSVRGLGTEFLDRWQDLEDRSLEGNAFLSRHFVLPCLRHLPESARSNPIALAVEEARNGELLGLGIFETCRGSRLLPLRHLRCWRSPHSFLDGILVDRRRCEEVAFTLFRWLRQQSRRWHGLSFRDRSADSELSAVLENAAATLGLGWREDWRSERAAIYIEELPEDPVEHLLPGKRRREVHRRMRRLESVGEVRFDLRRTGNDSNRYLENFLALEAMGWKGEKGTALNSSPGHEAFAREMVANFSSDGRIIFCELAADSHPVASALKLLSGDTCFSFKIGWDPAFKKTSPGVLCEVLFQQAASKLDGVRSVDGCTVPGSWLDVFWPWRRRLTTGAFPTSTVGKVVLAGTSWVKATKRRIRTVPK